MTPVVAEISEVAQTAGMMAEGLTEPACWRMTSTEAGINCMHTEFNTPNITIALLAVVLFPFKFDNSLIAIIPSGVAALPRPRRSALRLMAMAPFAG